MTAAVAFDTLKLARTLHDKAKFPQDQAEGLADAFAEIMINDLATKADIDQLQTRFEARMDALDSRLHTQQWILGLMAAALISILVKLFIA